MIEISKLEVTQIVPVLGKVRDKSSGCATLEEADQKLVDSFFSEYSDSIVLARLFATIPYQNLPASSQAFVSQLASAHHISGLLKDTTPVLSLLGTHGANPAWNDRRRSQGHVGIPLVSASFIDQIPMMSRLLKEVGLDVTWINNQNSNLMIEAKGRTSGIFYVEDASKAIDQQNRKIIAAQDFVQANGVKTVFGLAGGYATSNTFVTLIVFCRETLLRSQAALFSSLITNFKAVTTSLVTRGAFFKA